MSSSKPIMKNSMLSAPILNVALKSLTANYQTLKKISNAEVAGVVKANAYGLGFATIAETLRKSGCRTFFVATALEGVALRLVQPEIEIYVLSPCLVRDIELLINSDLKPCLYDIEGILVYNQYTKAAGKQPGAALHVETGINRLGLGCVQLLSFCGNRNNFDIKIDLVMGHLACADDPNSEINKLQLSRFQEALKMFPGVRASLANSAGIFLGAEYHFDLVRPGISLYGHDPHYKFVTPRVEPVVAFSAPLGQIKNLAKGEYVGYGMTEQCKRSTRLGVVLVGYADGISRCVLGSAKGNVSSFYLAGCRAPIIGRVSMDLTTVDLTDIPENELGKHDRLEIFGNVISLAEYVESTGVTPYEVLTRIGSRVKRGYVR